MEDTRCKNCGGNDWVNGKDYKVCQYCGAKYELITKPFSAQTSSISIDSDIERLLKKCQNEPHNCRKYANLILDIDPTNKEALKYLKR